MNFLAGWLSLKHLLSGQLSEQKLPQDKIPASAWPPVQSAGVTLPGSHLPHSRLLDSRLRDSRVPRFRSVWFCLPGLARPLTARAKARSAGTRSAAAVVCNGLASWRRFMLLSGWLMLTSASAVASVPASPSTGIDDMPVFRSAYQPQLDFPAWQQQGQLLLRQSLLLDELTLSASLLSEQLRQPSPHRRAGQKSAGQPYRHQQWRVQLSNSQYQTELTADLLWPVQQTSPSASASASPLASQQAAERGKPAVLLLHDHGAEFRLGRHKYLPAALTAQWQQRYFSGVALAELLVSAGYPVLLTDAPGFGERDALQYDEQQRLAARLLARGLSLAGIMAREDQALARWLASQSGQPVVAAGFSMGGFRALQQAALSEHVAAAVSIGWFNSLRFLRSADNNFSKGQTSFYLTHPGLYQALDLPDLWLLAAPKPLFVLMGAQDPLMPPEQVRQAFATLAQGYQAAKGHNATGAQLSAEAALCARLQLATDADSGHQAGHWYQQRLLQFLQDYSRTCSNRSN